MRLHRLWPDAQPRHSPGEPVRAGRGAGVREDSRAGPGGGDSGLAAAPPRFQGQPPVEDDFGRASDPETLGKLIAICEHNVFTPGTIWGMDPFDPWGLELGRRLAQRIIPELESKEEQALATAIAQPT